MHTENLFCRRRALAAPSSPSPSKLIGWSTEGARVRYNDSFVFTLIKKNREPGKRYKRYKLTPPEILAVYEPEMERVRARKEKKEADRLDQVGSVELVVCDWGKYEAHFLFHHNGKYYYDNGNSAGREDRICKSHVIAENVQRGTYEAAGEELRALRDGFGMLYDVQYAIEKGPGADCKSSETDSLYKSFNNLCQLWEVEFYEKAAAIIERGRTERILRRI